MNETKDHIFWWTRDGGYGFLSNFWRAHILIDGKDYPTSEHYYQAMKSLDPEEQEMIRILSAPKEAKFAGYHMTLREDWEEIKEEIMLKALRAKFTQYPNLRQKLLDTGTAILHEDSPWDKYWGFAKGKGKDRLGVLLMQVRDEIRENQQNKNI
jgi:ribA/ribD-fused uncharacterized protein